MLEDYSRELFYQDLSDTILQTYYTFSQIYKNNTVKRYLYMYLPFTSYPTVNLGLDYTHTVKDNLFTVYLSLGCIFQSKSVQVFQSKSVQLYQS
jgi:hypothetical protein